MHNPKSQRIMLIEDSDDDYYATKRALLSSYAESDLIRFVTAEEGIYYLNEHAGTMPNLILMDLNLPGKNGIAATREIKATPKLKDIPVVMLSSSQKAQDIADAYEAGVMQFLHKSSDVMVYFNHIRDVTKQCFENIE